MTIDQQPEPQGKLQRCAGVAIAAALAVFLGSFTLHVAKNPLRLDEVDYFQCMKHVVDLGLPLYYAGEVAYDQDYLIHLSSRRLDSRTFEFYRFKPETGILKETFFALTDTNSRYTYGMWQPPLYIYLGSVVFRLVSLTAENSSLLRYFNLVFGLGVFIGMAVLSRQLYGGQHREVFAVALWLFALNGLATRGSTLIDYNATLGPCIAIWFVVAYLHSEQYRNLNSGLVFLTILAFFTSLGIASSLLASTLAYALIGNRPFKPWRSLAAILTGTVLFVPLFLVFCRILQLPFTQPFLHNIHRAATGSSLAQLGFRLTSALTYSAWYSAEVGVAAILVGVVFLARLLMSREQAQAPARVLVPLTVLVSFLLNGSIRADAYGFPKYIVFLLPLLFVFLAGEGLGIVRAQAPGGLSWRAAVTAALLAVALQEGFDTARTLQQPGGTLYVQGEEGIVPIAHTLNALTDPLETVLSPKDIAFYANRRFVQWSGRLLTEADSLKDAIAQEHIRYIAASRREFSATSDAVTTYLHAAFTERSSIDDFVLLQQR